MSGKNWQSWIQVRNRTSYDFENFHHGARILGSRLICILLVVRTRQIILEWKRRKVHNFDRKWEEILFPPLNSWNASEIIHNNNRNDRKFLSCYTRSCSHPTLLTIKSQSKSRLIFEKLLSFAHFSGNYPNHRVIIELLIVASWSIVMDIAIVST